MTKREKTKQNINLSTFRTAIRLLAAENILPNIFFQFCSSTDESCEEDERLLPIDQSDIESSRILNDFLKFLFFLQQRVHCQKERTS